MLHSVLALLTLLKLHTAREVKWQRHVLPNTASGPWQEFWRNKDPQKEGWTRAPDDPQVNALRGRLEEKNCIRGLKTLSPSMHNYSSHAADVFRRDGFFVAHDVLTLSQVSALRNVTSRVLGKIFEVDPDGSFGGGAGKLPHRYSLGDSSGTRSFFHFLEYSMLLDLPTTTPVLKEIFASHDYQAVGSGGDVALAGAIEYQTLHLDAIWGNLRADPQDLAIPPVVTINFVLQDVTAINGPMRKVRGSHRWKQPPPGLVDEPQWMKQSTLCPLSAGSAIFRDNRVWHGGTPNLSDELRALPNLEFFAPDGSVPWWLNRKTMPFEVFRALTPFARHLARNVVAPPGAEIPGIDHYSPDAIIDLMPFLAR